VFSTSQSSQAKASELNLACSRSPRPACRILHFRASGADLEMDDEDFIDRAGAAITPCGSAVSAHGSLTIGNTEDHVPEYGSSIATGNLEDKMSSPRAVREFADWAFGAEGIPDLQVLACGNFSHGHYAKYNVLLCRAACGWHYLTNAETTCWDLVDDNMDMLSACAVDPIMVP
jgi:hypothetical protein